MITRTMFPYRLGAIVHITNVAANSNLASCSSSEVPGEHPPTAAENTVKLTPAQLKNVGVATGSMQRRSLGVLLPVQGVVDVPPQNLVSVSAPLGGYLRSTDLLPGVEVSKGQTIAVLEDQRFIQMQQDYLLSKGRVELLAMDPQRQQALNASKTVSDKVMQEATTAWEAEKVTLRALSRRAL